MHFILVFLMTLPASALGVRGHQMVAFSQCMPSSLPPRSRATVTLGAQSRPSKFTLTSKISPFPFTADLRRSTRSYEHKTEVRNAKNGGEKDEHAKKPWIAPMRRLNLLVTICLSKL